MKNNKIGTIVGKSPLFATIKEEDTDTLLSCLQPISRQYSKGSTIFAEGDMATNLWLVIEGEVQIAKDDCWGNRSIISVVMAGDMFGEAFACSNQAKMPVSAIAAQDCLLLSLDVNRILTTCPSSCVHHNQLIKNLVTVLASKNINLMSKISHMSQRKLRDKLLEYLSDQSKIHGSPTFTVPFNRQEMADYLSVDRSALSLELSKLAKEGIVSYNKSNFTLLDPPSNK